jgi:hypothetical protein
VRTLGYAAALDRDRTISLRTGVTLLYDSTHRTRLRTDDPSRQADYTVDVEQRATLSTTAAE